MDPQPSSARSEESSFARRSYNMSIDDDEEDFPTEVSDNATAFTSRLVGHTHFMCCHFISESPVSLSSLRALSLISSLRPLSLISSLRPLSLYHLRDPCLSIISESPVSHIISETPVSLSSLRALSLISSLRALSLISSLRALSLYHL